MAITGTNPARTSGIAILLAAAWVVPAAAAPLVVDRSTSAGAACQAANGPASGMFRRGGQYLEHIGSNDQYVVCHLPVETNAPGYASTFFMSATVSLVKPSGSVSCVAQVGTFAEGTQQVASAVTRAHVFGGSGESSTLYWDAPDVPALYYNESLVLICRMSPGTRLGTIRHRYQFGD